MYRNIRTLYNFDPPATDEEIRAAALQFVRKVSGFNQPSKANKAAFAAAVEEVSAVRSLVRSSSERFSRISLTAFSPRAVGVPRVTALLRTSVRRMRECGSKRGVPEQTP